MIATWLNGGCDAPDRSHASGILKRVSSSEYDDLLCRDEKNITNVSNVSNLPKRRKKNVNFSEIISCEKKRMIQQDNLRQDVVSYFKHKEDYLYYLSNFSLQLQRRAACGYMDTESPAGISKDQRKKIIKWQFEVGHRLAMSSEEIMAALCLFERCLSHRQYKYREAHMVSVICLALSSKLGDLRDNSETCIDALYNNSIHVHGFTKDKLIHAETEVMMLLDFELVQPNTATFVVIFLDELGIMQKSIYDMCCLLAETFAVEYESHQYLYSTVAETVVRIAIKSLNVKCENGEFFKLLTSNPCCTKCLFDIKKCISSCSDENIFETYHIASNTVLDFNVPIAA